MIGATAKDAARFRVTQVEWRRVVLWSLVILALTSLPIAAGYLMPNDTYAFTGAAHHPEDVMSYLSKMRQGYEGAWAVKLPYAVEPHPGIPFMYVFYLLLGHIARWTGISLIVLYDVARLLCSVFLLGVAYRFIAFVLPSRDWRWVAFVLATVAGGFGVWVILITGSFTLGGITPIDLWPLDFYTFALFFLSPHQTLGIALFLMILQSVATYWETAAPRHLIPGAVAALGESFIFPFMPLVYGSVLAIAWLWERRWRVAPLRSAAAALLVVLLPLPMVINYWLSMRGDPVWISFSSQNLTLSPPPWYYVLGYGLVGILAVPGAVWAWRSGPRGRLAVLIVVVSLILGYVPANFQRRLVGGAHIPMCALAAAGIYGWLVPLWRRWRPAPTQKSAYREGLMRAGIVAFSAVSSLYVLLGILISVVSYSPGIFIPVDTAVAIHWLETGTSSDAAIFSAFSTGTVIPAYTGRRVYWGHTFETPFLDRKQEEASRFFAATTSDAERQSMLKRYGLTYLVYGPDERAMGDYDPGSASYLKPVFEHGKVTIYEVAQ